MTISRRSFDRLSIGSAACTIEAECTIEKGDGAALAIDALGQFAPEAWPELTFMFHPSVAALEFSAGTAGTYARVREPRGEDKAPRRIEGTRETILFWRNNEGCSRGRCWN
jgi:hypothetical protein